MQIHMNEKANMYLNCRRISNLQKFHFMLRLLVTHRFPKLEQTLLPKLQLTRDQNTKAMQPG